MEASDTNMMFYNEEMLIDSNAFQPNFALPDRSTDLPELKYATAAKLGNPKKDFIKTLLAKADVCPAQLIVKSRNTVWFILEEPNVTCELPNNYCECQNDERTKDSASYSIFKVHFKSSSAQASSGYKIVWTASRAKYEVTIFHTNEAVTKSQKLTSSSDTFELTSRERVVGSLLLANSTPPNNDRIQKQTHNVIILTPKTPNLSELFKHVFTHHNFTLHDSVGTNEYLFTKKGPTDWSFLVIEYDRSVLTWLPDRLQYATEIVLMLQQEYPEQNPCCQAISCLQSLSLSNGRTLHFNTSNCTIDTIQHVQLTNDKELQFIIQTIDINQKHIDSAALFTHKVDFESLNDYVSHLIVSSPPKLFQRYYVCLKFDTSRSHDEVAQFVLQHLKNASFESVANGCVAVFVSGGSNLIWTLQQQIDNLHQHFSREHSLDLLSVSVASISDVEKLMIMDNNNPFRLRLFDMLIRMKLDEILRCGSHQLWQNLSIGQDMKHISPSNLPTKPATHLLAQLSELIDEILHPKHTHLETEKAENYLDSLNETLRKLQSLGNHYWERFLIEEILPRHSQLALHFRRISFLEALIDAAETAISSLQLNSPPNSELIKEKIYQALSTMAENYSELLESRDVKYDEELNQFVEITQESIASMLTKAKSKFAAEAEEFLAISLPKSVTELQGLIENWKKEVDDLARKIEPLLDEKTKKEVSMHNKVYHLQLEKKKLIFQVQEKLLLIAANGQDFNLTALKLQIINKNAHSHLM